MCQFLQFYHHQTALSHTKSSECMLSSSDHSHTPDLVNGFVTYYTATSESLWTAFLSYSDHSHIPYLVNYYANYCTASSESLWTAFLHFYHCQTTLTHQISKLLCNLLHCELRIALDCIFALFIIFRPLSHTRSSKLLCNLLHCGLRIALDCIFALLSSPDHSHTPDLVNYYATYCTASSESLWTAFLHLYHCQTTLTHQI